LAGALVIARSRVVAIVVTMLLAGSIILGYLATAVL
jgi:general stress protein CsbA